MIAWPSGVIVSLSQSKNTMNTFGGAGGGAWYGCTRHGAASPVRASILRTPSVVQGSPLSVCSKPRDPVRLCRVCGDPEHGLPQQPDGLGDGRCSRLFAQQRQHVV